MNQVVNELRSQRPVPADATEILPPELAKINAVFYFFEVGGKPCAMGFQRRGLKPVFRYRFNDDANRQKFVDDWVASAARQLAEKQRKPLIASEHVSVGDVLRASWGYDQTNVDFYQVVDLVGKSTVVIREISNKLVASDQVMPIRDSFTSEPFKKRINKYGGLKISSCQTAYKTEWDKSHYQTPWGMGH